MAASFQFKVAESDDIVQGWTAQPTVPPSDPIASSINEPPESDGSPPPNVDDKYVRASEPVAGSRFVVKLQELGAPAYDIGTLLLRARGTNAAEVKLWLKLLWKLEDGTEKLGESYLVGGLTNVFEDQVIQLNPNDIQFLRTQQNLGRETFVSVAVVPAGCPRDAQFVDSFQPAEGASPPIRVTEPDHVPDVGTPWTDTGALFDEDWLFQIEHDVPSGQYWATSPESSQEGGIASQAVSSVPVRARYGRMLMKIAEYSGGTESHTQGFVLRRNGSNDAMWRVMVNRFPKELAIERRVEGQSEEIVASEAIDFAGGELVMLEFYDDGQTIRGILNPGQVIVSYSDPLYNDHREFGIHMWVGDGEVSVPSRFSSICIC